MCSTEAIGVAVENEIGIIQKTELDYEYDQDYGLDSPQRRGGH